MDTLSDYQALLSQFGIRHFTAEEVFVKGQAHADPDHKGFDLNTDPPRCLWLNSIAILSVFDRVRDEIGGPLVISSCYRAPAYNAAIGGAEKSTHLGFFAGDVSSPVATPGDLFSIFSRLRNEGHFIGGLSQYPTFVHADNRGYRADW